MMKREMQFAIREDWAGKPLLDLLTTRFDYHPRDAWQDRILSGRLRINGYPADAGCVLALGDVLEYDVSDMPEPPVDLDVQVVYDDADLLVVNKPAGLPCHPAGRFFNHTLWAVLKMRHGIAEPIFVNRLDRETSGLVVVARTSESERKCRKQFADRRVEKRYVVLVEGVFPEQVRATGYLGPDPAASIRRRYLFVPVADPAGTAAGSSEWADTEFQRVARHGPVSEIQAIPHTGRTHQIRATLTALGFPVVGDKLYGRDPDLFLRFCRDELTDADRGTLRMKRQALHAEYLKFRHPRLGRPVEFLVPVPADMAECVRRLDGQG